MFQGDTSYEFTEMVITENEFKNLIFRGPHPLWEREEYKEQHEFLLSLCFNPILKVAQKLVNEYNKAHCRSAKSHPVPEKVFEYFNNQNIIAKTDGDKDEENSWFRRYWLLSKGFEKEIMGDLWIRNIAINEREEEHVKNGSFYIEDGNHRALVYAVRLECGKEHYTPVKALHATSWDITDFILGHSCQPTAALEDGGAFPESGGVNIEKRERSTISEPRSEIRATIRRCGSSITA